MKIMSPAGRTKTRSPRAGGMRKMKDKDEIDAGGKTNVRLKAGRQDEDNIAGRQQDKDEIAAGGTTKMISPAGGKTNTRLQQATRPRQYCRWVVRQR